MKNSNVTEGNLLTDKVDIQLNVLGAPMMNGVGGEVDSRYVITKYHRGLVDGTRELGEKLTKPRALSHGVSHGTVLSLGAGAEHGGLPLGGPRDERRAKIDAVARGRTPRVEIGRAHV